MSATSRNMTAVATLLLTSAAPALATGGDTKLREIRDGVYSFTLGEGNYSMFVIGKTASPSSTRSAHAIPKPC